MHCRDQEIACGRTLTIEVKRVSLAVQANNLRIATDNYSPTHQANVWVASYVKVLTNMLDASTIKASNAEAFEFPNNKTRHCDGTWKVRKLKGEQRVCTKYYDAWLQRLKSANASGATTCGVRRSKTVANMSSMSLQTTHREAPRTAQDSVCLSTRPLDCRTVPGKSRRFDPRHLACKQCA